MSENKKPRLCEVLGVDIGERFRHIGNDADIWIDKDGAPCTDAECYTSQDIVWAVMDIINHPKALIRKPHLTEPELTICKAVGAEWVSRDTRVDSEIVDLWKIKPARTKNGSFYSKDEGLLGSIISELFPSVKTGDCIWVEE